MKRNSPSITPRETQIWALVYEGHSNKEIAVLLKMAAATVKVHMGRIFLKTGCPNRAALAGQYQGASASQPTRANHPKDKTPASGRRAKES